MPRKWPVTCYRLKFEKTTILLPVSSSTNLQALRVQLLEALKHGGDQELKDLDLAVPTSANEIALWRRLGSAIDGEAASEDAWERLQDERSGADRWGLDEAEEIGVSFRSSDGEFSPPNVVRPVEDEDEEAI